VHLKAICKNTGGEFAGALLRPHGPALKGMKGMGMPVDDISEAAVFNVKLATWSIHIWVILSSVIMI